MLFETCVYTNKGGRDNNEDYCTCGDGIWVLCDGLGGHDCGEVASETGASAALRFAEENGPSFDDKFLKDILSEANSSVIAMQKDEKLKGMRTTIVLAFTDGKKIRYANVGDSRFYYFKNNSLAYTSEDHSVSALSARLGDISYDDIRNDVDRNKLIKVLGNEPDINVKIPNVIIPVESGDAFLLCSDGFWEHVYETEMELDLAKSDSAQEWMNYMIKRILLKTRNIGNDNFTAAGVMISD
ncbi:MAG: serine/threonine-protein phosphatase [Oscillospiraceae bacterium]|nr:serine/threonine-protein phosphatase [Oscillospiraceae bacterium]